MNYLYFFDIYNRGELNASVGKQNNTNSQGGGPQNKPLVMNS